MKIHCKIATSVGLMLMLASAALAQHVKTDYDHNANFGQYKTYSWEKVETPNPLWEDRIKGAVERILTEKGWTQVPSGGDIAVVAIGTTQEKQSLDTFYTGMGGWRWRGFGETTTTVETYRVGTLVVDLFDASSKKLIWRGSSTGTLSNKTDKNIKNLDKDAQEMFAHFPPGS